MNSWIRSQKEEKIYIAVMNRQEWADTKECRNNFCVRPFSPSLRYCRMERKRNLLWIQMETPSRKSEIKEIYYSIWIAGNLFVIVGEDDFLVKNMTEIMKKMDEKMKLEEPDEKWAAGYLSSLLEQWLKSILKDDLEFLQSVELEIAGLEEAVLKGKCQEFNARMLPVKKQIARFYRYYNQLVELSQELEELGEFSEKESEESWLNGFKERCSLLAGQTQIIREYMIQVQEVYQSEIEIRQNDVMKALTMVTTICFPLTLVAGWYGMNFKYMPEIYSRYGYPVVIFICVIIIIISLIIFKKKNFW